MFRDRDVCGIALLQISNCLFINYLAGELSTVAYFVDCAAIPSRSGRRYRTGVIKRMRASI